MQTNSKKAEQVGLPATSRLSRAYGRADFVDAFSVDLPATACNDAESLARYIFAEQPKWIAMLQGVRDIAVWPFGLKRTVDLKVARGDRLSIFRVFERHKDEIILGEDENSLPATYGWFRRTASRVRQGTPLWLCTRQYRSRPRVRAPAACPSSSCLP